MLTNNKIKLIIFIIFILNVTFITDIYVQDAKKVETVITGKFILGKGEKSFDESIVQISLYKIDRRLADASADLVDVKTVRSFKHKKGKASKIKFSFKDTDYDTKKYYLSAYIYLGKTIVNDNAIFHGTFKNGDGFNVIKSTKENVKLYAKRIKDYTENEKIKLPITYYAEIPNNIYNRQVPIVASYTINKDTYKYNLYGFKSKKELCDKLDTIKKTIEEFEKFKTIELDIYFEIQNVSKDDIAINIASNDKEMRISSNNSNFKSFKLDASPKGDDDSKLIKLKPNEKYKWKLQLTSGYKGLTYNYFTDKGEYHLELKQNIYVKTKKYNTTDNYLIEVEDLYINIE